MTHKKVPDGYCNANVYLNLVSSKWTAHVIWLLNQHEKMRFGQIKKQLAFVSSKVLSTCLRSLEHYEFIWRKEDLTVPVTVEYGLTSRGHELANIVLQIVEKSDEWEANRSSSESFNS